MAFESITFTYTPPPTVPNQGLNESVLAAAEPVVSTSTSVQANSSTAASLAAQLGDLIDTSKYLQSVIYSLHSGLGVTVDQSNPDLGMALSVIYNGQVPEAVSLAMYGYLLDAELGSLQVNMAAGPNAGVEANSFQQQALITINKAVESQLAADGGVAAQSALLLRSLKSSAIMNAGIQSQLLDYPAATSTKSTPSLNVILASGIDVSSDVAALVQAHITAAGQVASSMYQTLTQPDPIASDVASVVGALATCSVVDLIRMSSMLSMTGQSLANSVLGLSTGISSFIFPQAVAQSSGLMMQLDKIVQMAVTPSLSANNVVTSIVQSLASVMKPNGMLAGVIRTMKQPAAAQLTGPLASMPMNNSAVSGLSIGSPIPPSISSLGFSPGINEMSSLMSFCTSQTVSSSTLQKDSFQRLTARVDGDQGTSTQILAATTSIKSLSSLVTAFTKEQQNNAAISTQDASAQLQTIGNILSSSTTGSGSSYVVQNGVVSVTPLAVPPTTPGAAAVFANSGIQSSLAGLNQTVRA